MKQRVLADDQDGAVWHHDRRRQTSIGSSHHHDELEFNLVVRGTARYAMQGRWYDLEVRGLVWLFPAQEHLLVERSPDFEMWIAVFARSALRRWLAGERDAVLLEPDPPGHFCRRLPSPVCTGVLRECERLSRLGEDRNRFALGLGRLLIEAWRAFEDEGRAVSRGRLPPTLTHALHLLIAGDGDEDLVGLAARCGVGPAQLGRLFRRHLGENFVDLRNRQRLERVRLARETGPDRTLLALALDAGFGSYAQFHRVCVKLLGTNPRKAFRLGR